MGPFGNKKYQIRLLHSFWSKLHHNPTHRTHQHIYLLSIRKVTILRTVHYHSLSAPVPGRFSVEPNSPMFFSCNFCSHNVSLSVFRSLYSICNTENQYRPKWPTENSYFFSSSPNPGNSQSQQLPVTTTIMIAFRLEIPKPFW